MTTLIATPPVFSEADILASRVTPEEVIERNESTDEWNVFAGQFREAFDSLGETERIVLARRFGERATLEAIGRDLNITRERIRQIQAQALRKLELALKPVRPLRADEIDIKTHLRVRAAELRASRARARMRRQAMCARWVCSGGVIRLNLAWCPRAVRCGSYLRRPPFELAQQPLSLLWDATFQVL